MNKEGPILNPRKRPLNNQQQREVRAMVLEVARAEGYSKDNRVTGRKMRFFSPKLEFIRIIRKGQQSSMPVAMSSE